MSAFPLTTRGPQTAADWARLNPMLDQFEIGFVIDSAGLSSESWCQECRTVVWFDNGKWGAMNSTYHDDKVIALAIANYVRVKLLGQFVGFVGVMPETGYAR